MNDAQANTGHRAARKPLRKVLIAAALVIASVGVVAVPWWFASRNADEVIGGDPGTEETASQMPEGMCGELDITGIDRLAGQRDPGSDSFSDDDSATGEFHCDYWYAVTDTEGAWLKASAEIRPGEDWSSGIAAWIEGTAVSQSETPVSLFASGMAGGLPEGVAPLEGGEDWDAAGMVVDPQVLVFETVNGDTTGRTFELRMADADLQVHIFFARRDTGDEVVASEDIIAELIALAEQVRAMVEAGA